MRCDGFGGRRNELYTSRFNFKASDLYDGKIGKDITTFYTFGSRVEHHCFIFFEGWSDIHAGFSHDQNSMTERPGYHVHHSHPGTRARDPENVWGLGWDVLGSHIFDYWWDPSHFCDRALQ